MVQRKVPGKLGILDSGGLKTDCHPSTTMRPSLQNHDTKNKGTDLKKKMMKKSRSLIKRADYESLRVPLPRRHEPPKQPGQPPPCTAAGGAPASPQKKSPNYMKSTSSSEAKKEQQTPVSTQNIPARDHSSNGPCPRISTNSKSKLHSSSHKLSRTSSLNRVRSLIKAPSFKAVRTSVVNRCSRKIVICSELDVQRATCSSTLKESKFPPYLMLNPGGSESEGTSIMKVCPYNYCSLNGHRHSVVPPLKSFLSARRRMLKAQSIRRLEFFSPSKTKPSDHDKTLHEVDSEPVFIDDVPVTPEMKINPLPVEEKASSELLCSKSDMDAESSVAESMEELFAEISDMEWEEGQLPNERVIDEDIILSQMGNGYDQNLRHLSGNQDPSLKPGDDFGNFFKKIQADEELLDPQEAIIQWQEKFSDLESLSGGVCQNEEVTQSTPKSTSPGEEELLEEPIAIMKETNCISETKNEILNMDSMIRDDATIRAENVINESLVNKEEREVFRPIESNSLPKIQVSDSYQDFTGSSDGERSSDHRLEYLDDKLEDLLMAENVITETSLMEKETHMGKKQVDVMKLLTYSSVPLMEVIAVEDDEAEDDVDRSLNIFAVRQQAADDKNRTEVEDHSVDVEQTDKFIVQELVDLEEQINMKMKKSCFSEECIEEIEAAQKEGIATSDAAETFSNPCTEMDLKKDDVLLHGRSNYTQAVPDTSSSSKRTIRCKRPIEDSEEMRKFNPREPNYLPVEPETEGERVDLRHQEIDERKNAEEWMVDYALQQAVSKLAPARKRKVALLVAAFETVMPIPKCEMQLRKNTAGFAHARPMQACS